MEPNPLVRRALIFHAAFLAVAIAWRRGNQVYHYQ